MPRGRCALPAEIRETDNQDGRQIIHTVVAHIFELLHEIGLPGTAHAGDDDEAKCIFVHGMLLW